MERDGPMKVCSICGVEKPWADYHKDRKTKSGYEHRCKECNLKRRKEYGQRPESKILAASSMSEYRRKNKAKVQARNKVHYHIKVGNMTRPTQCKNCQSVGHVEAHHEDYSKPLDVIWLCKPCHVEADRAKQEQS